nr:hypothetical protein [Candidatus Sigynarchaeota archaeon]
MSYIPKYILKRMFSADCLKKVKGGIELTMVNVISPIAAKDLPENLSEFLSVKVDGKPIPADIINRLAVTVNGKRYDAKNLKELNGQTLPVGASMVFFVPFDAVKPGEEHEIALDAKSTKFQFVFSRVVK